MSDRSGNPGSPVALISRTGALDQAHFDGSASKVVSAVYDGVCDLVDLVIKGD